MRLIDADALIKTLNEEKIKFNADVNYFILNAPTVYAEPIVRCKDCKYYESKCDYPFCYYTENNVETDDYCSFGEKREVEE